MKELTIVSSAALPQISEIEEFELNNNIKLPASFINFLLTHNVIQVEENQFYDKHIGVWREIDLYYPFDYRNELSLQMIHRNLFVDLFEKKYVAFAGDSGGWQYAFSIQKSDFGKVYFCRTDEAIEDGASLLADSFEEFIDGLQKTEDYMLL